MEPSDLLSQWPAVANTGGLALFAYVVYHQLGIMRVEIVGALATFTAAAESNGRHLAVLIDRSERSDHE